MATVEMEILSLVGNQVGDFIMSAQAEIFLFTLAVVAHLVLFGNVFPKGASRKKEFKEEPPVPRNPTQRVRRTIPSAASGIEECEHCLQAAFSDGDYHSVLRCWSILGSFVEAPSVNLASVVEAMQRLQKDHAFIISELQEFFKKHTTLFGIDIMNDLLESLVKTLDNELAQKILNMGVAAGIRPDGKTYDALLALNFAARNFRGVRKVHEEMKAKHIPCSLRATIVLLKTGLRTNDLTEVLHRFREARRLWSGFGEGPNQVLPQVIDLACKEHQLASLFPEIRDMEFTSDIVSSLLAEGVHTKNFALVQEIENVAREQRVPLTDRSYLLLIKAASSGSRVRKLFEEMIQKDLEWSADIGTAILSFCHANNDLKLADYLFQNMKPTQIAVLCAVIRFYSEKGAHEKVCDVYAWHMKHQSASLGVPQRTLLDARTERCLMNSLMKCGRESMAKGILDAAPANVAKHIAMIRDCAEKGNLEGAVSIFLTLEKSGAELSCSMYNSVLDACIECGDLRRAVAWMQRMKDANVADLVTYNTMVKGLVRNDLFDKARTLIEEMSAAGVPPNNITYNEMINAMVKNAYVKKAQVWEVVDEMSARGIPPNRVTCSILLKDLKAKSHYADVKRTMSLIDAIDEPMDEVLLSSVVEACVRVGKPELLSGKLAKLTEAITVTGAHTFGSLIKAHGFAKDIDGAWRCWKEMRSRHIKPTSVTIGCMVEAIVSNGDPEGAYELIQQLEDDDNCSDQVNAIIYGSVLKGFGQAKKAERALAVWEDMVQKRVIPSVTTYNALIDACARGGLMDRVPQFLVDMKADKVMPNLITYSTVLKGHCLRGDVSSALAVLQVMRRETNLKPDEIMYNTLLDGCAQARMADEGMRLLEQMQEEDIRPTNYTLSVLVKLVSTSNRTATGLQKAFDMVEALTRKYRFRPNAPVYGNLVQACVASGATQRGLSLLEQMGRERVQPDIRSYGVLTRSCMSSGLHDEAVRLVRGALGLQNAGPYPAMSPNGNAQSAKGAEDLVNDTLRSLVTRGRTLDLAAPLLSDIRQGRSGVRVDPAVQRKIASSVCMSN